MFEIDTFLNNISVGRECLTPERIHCVHIVREKWHCLFLYFEFQMCTLIFCDCFKQYFESCYINKSSYYIKRLNQKTYGIVFHLLYVICLFIDVTDFAWNKYNKNYHVHLILKIKNVVVASRKLCEHIENFISNQIFQLFLRNDNHLIATIFNHL